MRGPGHRHATLGEVTDDELDGMLAESETLFVEHKGNLDPTQNYAFAKAVASFANTLGGWVLVGVTDCEPNEGTEVGWSPPDSHALIDRVRQVLSTQIDPLPAFAAVVRVIRGKRVGVVRVYESVDTPHILRNGSVVVREPAQDKNLRALGRAEAKPVATHYELSQLAQRGERARVLAEGRLAEGALPFVETALDLRYTDAITASGVAVRRPYSALPTVIVRATPLAMTRTFDAWASSLSAEERCQAAALELVSDGVVSPPIVAARGVAVTARGTTRHRTTMRPSQWTGVRASAVVDAGGAVAIGVAYDDVDEDNRLEFARDRFVTDFLEPPIVAAARMLQEAELFGRYLWHVHLLRLGTVLRVERDSGGTGSTDVPLGGELTIPALAQSAGGEDEASTELRGLLDGWGHETSRGVGVRSWPAAG